VFVPGIHKGMAAGYHANDYFLYYAAQHQPRFREFNLPADATYRIDVIDTWNMTVNRFADAVQGRVIVELPRRQYMAVRMVRNL
jgi:hypothetical protein